VNVLDESTPTGAIAVSSDLSVSGPRSARPPADAPGVVFGTPPVQATYGQSTPTGGNCPASTDGALMKISPKSVASTHGANGVDCPASTDDALSIPGPACARPPADGPGELYGTLPVQAIFGRSTPTGGSSPASANGAQGCTSYLAASGFSAPEPGYATLLRMTTNKMTKMVSI